MMGMRISVAVIFSAPLLALSLEPADPVSFCHRFIDQNAIETCQMRTAKENVDWYAAAICNMQKEDSAFWSCWDSVKDKSINLQVLKKCDDSEFGDDQRQACVESSLNSRSPASANSADLFQPLKTKKKK